MAKYELKFDTKEAEDDRDKHRKVGGGNRMTEEYEEKVRNKILSLLPGIKQNPNHFIIIDKWNNKIWREHRFEVFEYLSAVVDEQLEEVIKERASYYADIKSIHK